MRLEALAISTLSLMAAASLSAAAATDDPGGESRAPVVAKAVRHDTSAPLRLMPARPIKARPDKQIPIRIPLDLAARHKGAPEVDDPLLQEKLAETATPLPSLSFDGLSDDDNAAVIGGRVVPPDTNGDVGANHYVQFINLILAVYNKSTGARVFGPVAGNSIWAGFGGICEANNDGDPVVLYDHLADRWVVSQFAIGADGHQCVAVSTTGDPTGSYHRYDFVVSPGAFNDYPKLGVWGDAYYMSANEFTSSFTGAVAVAFERAPMLTGAAARMVKFGPLPCTNTECFFSLQPSDLEGAAPPAGTPNTFVMSWDDETWGTGAASDGYRRWDFSVNWAAPGSSTFTALPQVNAPEFDANLCNFNACALQPRPGERLDTLSQFTMYRASYRTVLGNTSLLVSHTVDARRNLPGVRWTELRRDGGGWFLHQTGTFSPDSQHRWMSSINMDKAGNIAIGFSVSDRRSTFPSVRYATRAATDALGTMGSEVELVAGAGAQQNSFNRWGDYSSMSVDPVNGCTFWYTQEYYANTGSFDFKTRIGSFTVPGCQ
jgi:hypothetical protein